MPPHDVAKPRGEAEGTGPPRGKYGKFATPGQKFSRVSAVRNLHCTKSLCTWETVCACEALVGRVDERQLPAAHGTRPRRLCDDAPRAPELNDAGRVRLPAPHENWQAAR
jgi:hypothetical protein